MHTRTPSLIAIILILTAPLCADEPKPASPTDAVVATMKAIREAQRAGDPEAWNRLVAPECQFVEPNGRLTTRSWHAPEKLSTPPSATTSDLRLSQINARIQGSTALLTYREDASTQLGGQTITTRTRFTEIYVRNAELWQLVLSAETPIAEKKPLAVDLRTYNDYVGEYQMAPGLVGKIYRDGDRLMLIGTGWKQPYELLPLGHDTFFVKEMPDNEIAFQRDKDGKVIAQGPAPGSQGPTGPKIK